MPVQASPAGKPQNPAGNIPMGKHPTPPQATAPSGAHPCGNMPSSASTPGVKPGRTA
jgi:hypothetical protein